jgi:hypothetical protein
MCTYVRARAFTFVNLVRSFANNMHTLKWYQAILVDILEKGSQRFLLLLFHQNLQQHVHGCTEAADPHTVIIVLPCLHDLFMRLLSLSRRSVLTRQKDRTPQGLCLGKCDV